MKCPACKSSLLKPMQLTHGLPARECTSCHGVLIDLLSYRHWAESYTPEKPETPPDVVEVKESPKALTCPKCAKIMLKFRISGETANRVDVCTDCGEAWLDQGEWELLGSLAIQDRMNAIFTDPWQRRIREESARKGQEARIADKLGSDDYAKLKAAKAWLDAHPQKSELLRYLLSDRNGV